MRDRRARVAVAALFLSNGALFANLLPRYPEIKIDLGMSNAIYGVAIAAFSVGALVTGPSAAMLIRRFRSAPVAVWGSVGIAAFAWLAGVAPSVWTVAGALFVAGGADAVTDVAQNAHGLRVQRRYGRSIINSFHAVWSAGAILGGAMGAAAIALHMSRGAHLAVSAVVFSAMCVIAYRFLLPGPDETAARDAAPVAMSRSRVATYAALAAVVTIAIAAAVVEDSGSSWATLYLRELGAPGAVAVFGYIAAVGFQFIGRLVGDRLVDQFGQRAVARTGGAIAAAGMALALAFPSVPAMIGGFAAAGLGVASLIPAAMQRADELPGLRHGTGLTAVTWLMRVGFVCAPMIVGALADGFSLRVGLLTVPVAGLVVIAFARVLARRIPPGPPKPPGNRPSTSDQPEPTPQRLTRAYAQQTQQASNQQRSAVRRWQRKDRFYEQVQNAAAGKQANTQALDVAAHLDNLATPLEGGDVQVWRGVRDVEKELGVSAAELTTLVGHPKVLQRFMSTTTERAVATAEFNTPGANTAVLDVTAREGVRAVWMPPLGNPDSSYQQELLFPPGQRLSIIGVDTSGDIPVISVEVSPR